MSKRKPFRILELFSGSRSLGVIAEAMGLQHLGTSGMSGAYERSKVPEQLVWAVLVNAHRMYLAGLGPWSNK